MTVQNKCLSGLNGTTSPKRGQGSYQDEIGTGQTRKIPQNAAISSDSGKE